MLSCAPFLMFRAVTPSTWHTIHNTLQNNNKVHNILFLPTFPFKLLYLSSFFLYSWNSIVCKILLVVQKIGFFPFINCVQTLIKNWCLCPNNFLPSSSWHLFFFFHKIIHRTSKIYINISLFLSLLSTTTLFPSSSSVTFTFHFFLYILLALESKWIFFSAAYNTDLYFWLESAGEINVQQDVCFFDQIYDDANDDVDLRKLYQEAATRRWAKRFWINNLRESKMKIRKLEKVFL